MIQSFRSPDWAAFKDDLVGAVTDREIHEVRQLSDHDVVGVVRDCVYPDRENQHLILERDELREEVRELRTAVMHARGALGTTSSKHDAMARIAAALEALNAL